MYRLTETDQVYRISDGTLIPADPLNRDRQQYDQWLLSGNCPESQALPPPQTKAQRIAALLAEVGAKEEWQVQAAAAGLLALFIARGKTEADAYADSPLYHKAKDVMDEIEAIRAEP